MTALPPPPQQDDSPTPNAHPTEWETDSFERPPLPPGHPVSWGLLTNGTVLDGAEYPFPVFSDWDRIGNYSVTLRLAADPYGSRCTAAPNTNP